MMNHLTKMNKMGQNDYELLKLETKINNLEKELSGLFADFKKHKSKYENYVMENQAYQKLEKMNICCLNLLQVYREYVKNFTKK